MRTLRRQVLTHDVDRWARTFLDALGLPPNDRHCGAGARRRSCSSRWTSTASSRPIVEVPADARGPARRARGDPGARRATGNDRRAGVRAGAGRPGRGRPGSARRSGWSAATALEPDDGPARPRRRPARTARSARTPRWTRWSTASPGCALSASPPGWRCTCAGPSPRSARACSTRCAAARRAAPGIVSHAGQGGAGPRGTAGQQGCALDRCGCGARPRCSSRATTSRTRRRSPGCAPATSGVKVGDGDTAAAYRVADPATLAELLGPLLAARRRAALAPTERGGAHRCARLSRGAVPRCCHPGRPHHPRRTSRPRAAARSWCRRSARSAASPGAAGCGRRAAAAAGPRPGPSPARAAARW